MSSSPSTTWASGSRTWSAGAPGEEFTYADAETELSYGDVILVSGRTEQVERFAELP